MICLSTNEPGWCQRNSVEIGAEAVGRVGGGIYPAEAGSLPGSWSSRRTGTTGSIWPSWTFPGASGPGTTRCSACSTESRNTRTRPTTCARTTHPDGVSVLRLGWSLQLRPSWPTERCGERTLRTSVAWSISFVCETVCARQIWLAVWRSSERGWRSYLRADRPKLSVVGVTAAPGGGRYMWVAGYVGVWLGAGCVGVWVYV